MPWFGAKTLYRLTAKGRAKNTDQCYDPDATLLEERVVLFEAKSAEQAKKLAAEKLEQMKKMSADDAKKMAEEKMEKYKTMPMINKVSYGAAAAILLMLLMSIFTKPSSPEDRAQAVCEALSDGDFEEAAGYAPEKDQEGVLGLFLVFGGSEKELEKMSNYDCTIKKTKTKGDTMKVYFEGAPIVKMRLKKDDGEYYWRM